MRGIAIARYGLGGSTIRCCKGGRLIDSVSIVGFWYARNCPYTQGMKQFLILTLNSTPRAMHILKFTEKINSMTIYPNETKVEDDAIDFRN